MLTLDVTNKQMVENKRTIIISNLMSCSQSAITRSQLAIETLEQGVKYVQS